MQVVYVPGKGTLMFDIPQEEFAEAWEAVGIREGYRLYSIEMHQADRGHEMMSLEEWYTEHKKATP